jgi:fatty-acyl-CoA synthase
VQWDIGYIPKKRARFTPNKKALIYEDTPITYKELNDNINRFANYMQAKGIKKGDRVSVMILNCPEFVEIYFAAAKLGVIFVPLNFRMVGPEVEYQLNDSGTRLFVFNDMFTETVNSIRSRVKVEHDKYIFLKSRFPGAPVRPDWASDYSEVVRDYPADEPQPDKPVELNDPLAILYTSGVTGDPKGAVVSHQQTFFKNFQVVLYTDIRPDDTILAQLPLFHSGGLFITATPTFNRGATLILRQGFNPEQFANDIARYKATVIFALTTMWRFILDSGRLDEIDKSSVRIIAGGGERTPEGLFHELAKRGLFMQQGFGQTENSAMMMLPKEDIIRKMGSVGLPGFFTEVWIVDNEGNEVPPGVIGRIVARGPTVMSGYWEKPDETSETIVDGILHTGDLGYRDEECYFYIVDRAKDMYRSGGENVYPAEVEKVLIDYPKISNVAIIGVPDKKWGETGKAFVVLSEEGTELTLEELREFLNGKVAKFKFPTRLEIMDELPITASGKVKKVELKKKEKKL